MNRPREQKAPISHLAPGPTRALHSLRPALDLSPPRPKLEPSLLGNECARRMPTVDLPFPGRRELRALGADRSAALRFG